MLPLLPLPCREARLFSLALVIRLLFPAAGSAAAATVEEEAEDDEELEARLACDDEWR